MAQTYRAAYYVAANGQETRLTGPEHAHLPEGELIAEAVAEAHRAGLVGDEYPCVTEEELRARLSIGEYEG